MRATNSKKYSPKNHHNQKLLKQLLIIGQYLPAILLLIIFILSTNFFFYSFFKNFFSIMDAYLYDQLLFLVIFLILVVINIHKKFITISFYSILLFILLMAFILISQSEILQRYFIKDDLLVIFPRFHHLEKLDNTYLNRQDFFYYHFLPFTLLFRIFRYDSIYYNIFSLTFMAVAGSTLIYMLKSFQNLYQIKHLYLLIIPITLFFLTTPALMDSYMYLEHSVATGYIVVFVLISIIFYIKFLNEPLLPSKEGSFGFLLRSKRRASDSSKDNNQSKFRYFLLSYLLLLIMLKTALTRAGALPFCLIITELFYLKRKLPITPTITRITLLLIPFLIMIQPYLTNSPGRLYEQQGLGINRLLDLDRFYLVFANLIPMVIPYQIFAPIYKKLYILGAGGWNEISTSFVVNNLFFVFGLGLFFMINLIIFFLFIKKVDIKLIVLVWLYTLINLLFYMLFGNDEKGLGNTFDRSIFHYASIPGSRYYPIPLAFILVTLYLTVTNMVDKLAMGKKVVIFGVFFLILILSIMGNIKFIKMANADANVGIVIYKKVAEGVLKTVPQNNNKKVVFSTNGDIKPVTFIGRGFPGFYDYTTLSYIDNKDELIKYLRENKIAANDFYAFYFDDQTYIFKDQSEEYRQKLSQYLVK